MKNILQLSLAFLCINPLTITAQNILKTAWEKQVILQSDGDTDGWGIDVDENGDVYWPISSDSFGNGLDIFLYKFDADGKPLWSFPTQIGGPGVQQSYVCNEHKGKVYIGGRYCPGLIQTCDMYVIQVDADDGIVDWSSSLDFGQDGYEEVDGLVIQEDGIYCGGWAHALETGVFNADIGLWKLDHNGNTIWQNSVGETGQADHQDGHFVVDENYIYAAGLWGGTGITNLYGGHSFLGRFNKDDGSFQDSVLFGFPSNRFFDLENALGMTSDGEHLYVTGYTTPTASNNWQILLAKFDKDLNQIWMKHWGEEGTESARAIDVYNDKIYIGGVSESDGISQSDEADALLAIFDTDGNFLSYHTWGDEKDNAIQDIIVNEDGIYLTGTTTDLPSQDFKKSAFLLKVDHETTSNSQVKSLPVSIFPNPGDDMVKIPLSRKWDYPINIQVFQTDGHLIHEQDITIPQTKLNITTSNWPQGMYEIKLQSNLMEGHGRWLKL